MLALQAFDMTMSSEYFPSHEEGQTRIYATAVQGMGF